MTRAVQIRQAMRAMRKARATPRSLPDAAAMTFHIFEDGGDYHWALVDRGGEALAQSAGFASYEDAEQAAGIVHRGACRASFQDRDSEAATR